MRSTPMTGDAAIVEPGHAAVDLRLVGKA